MAKDKSLTRDAATGAIVKNVKIAGVTAEAEALQAALDTYRHLSQGILSSPLIALADAQNRSAGNLVLKTLPITSFSFAVSRVAIAMSEAMSGQPPSYDAAWLSHEPAAPKSALAQEAVAEIATLSEGDALPPVHPGEILAEDFLPDAGLSPIKAAQRMGVPRTRIERLVAGQVSMTPDTALRLERLFGASAEYWMNLQTKHDLDMARAVAAPALEAIEPVFANR